jgi:hypothetical protein
VPLFRPGIEQKVAYTGTAAQSTAVADTTRAVRLLATTDCFVRFGADPTATSTNGLRLTAGIPEVFGIIPGQRISAIRASADGTLNLTEFA